MREPHLIVASPADPRGDEVIECPGLGIVQLRYGNRRSQMVGLVLAELLEEAIACESRLTLLHDVLPEPPDQVGLADPSRRVEVPCEGSVACHDVEDLEIPEEWPQLTLTRERGQAGNPGA